MIKRKVHAISYNIYPLSTYILDSICKCCHFPREEEVIYLNIKCFSLSIIQIYPIGRVISKYQIQVHIVAKKLRQNAKCNCKLCLYYFRWAVIIFSFHLYMSFSLFHFASIIGNVTGKGTSSSNRSITSDK